MRSSRLAHAVRVQGRIEPGLLAHISMWMCVYLRLIGSSSSLLSATSPDKMRLINSSAATRARCVLAASVPIRVRQDAAGDERRGPATH